MDDNSEMAASSPSGFNQDATTNKAFTDDGGQLTYNGKHYPTPPTVKVDMPDKQNEEHYTGPSTVKQNGDLSPNSKEEDEEDHEGKEEDEEDHEEKEEDYSLLTLLPFLNKAVNKMKHKIGINNDENWRRIQKITLVVLLVTGYIAYFIAVLVIYTALQDTDYWCDGDGLLIILTSITAIGLVYFQIIKPFFGKIIYKKVLKPLASTAESAFSNIWVTVACTVLIFAALLAFLIWDSWEELRRLQSLIGLAVLTAFGFLFSTAPGKIRWRHVLWGMALQFILGLIILKWSVGRAIFDCLAGKVTTFLKFTDVGSSFVFGVLVSEFGIFAFSVLSVTLFFSFCIQILYYFGAMQWLVIKIGWALQVTVGTTACESVNAAANIFLGQTEAPLVIKPYLGKMTKSEIHAVMTGGFATIAGSVLAAYISFGVDAASLLSASVMSAPAALAFSKLFYPEVEESKTTTSDIKIDTGEEANWLHAAMVGVTNAIPMVANIAANLICFYAFIAFCSHILNWLCMLAGAEEGVCYIENIFGWIFMPLAWVLGVDWSECHKVGELIGLKTIVNEFVAYDVLARMLKAGELSKRAEIISTYALCGFSNISSIGIMLGGLGAMAPERRRDMATVVVRAMIAGSCACFLTACVAGTLLSDADIERDTNGTTTLSSVLYQHDRPIRPWFNIYTA